MLFIVLCVNHRLGIIKKMKTFKKILWEINMEFVGEISNKDVYITTDSEDIKEVINKIGKISDAGNWENKIIKIRKLGEVFV